MRRILIIAFALAISAQAHAAGGDKAKKDEVDVDKRTLSAASVVKYLTPYADSIRACYGKHGLAQKKATGDMRLELIIHRDGSVFRLKVYAPGVKGKALGKCITKLSKKWSFPPRKGFTHVLVPFFYLRTKAKGAGPTITCWSARGCPKKRRAQRAKVKGGKAKDKSDKDKKGTKAGGKDAKKADKGAKKGKSK
ncbi:MAG: AgmX/PglI C-terminal domain-containing protein [Deltaproteobacteria bacterium]|nr:AgmX/PglI C-terminal domain-containing protein [Deltaproteobacteria bacterium]